MTPAQLVSSVRAQFQEPTASFITAEELYGYIWDAERLLSSELEEIEGTDTSLTTVAATREYTIPTDIIMIGKATWNAYPLKKIDLKDLDKVEETAYGATGSSGNPEYYYEWGGKIGLSPIPASAQTLKLWEIGDPTRLTAVSTSFTIAAWLAHYLQDYALYRMYLKEGADLNKANFHLQLWENGLKDARNKWTRKKSKNRVRSVKDVDSYPGTDIGII